MPTILDLQDQANELLQRRAKIIDRSREILEAAETEDRDLTSEEEANYDEAMDDVTKLAERVKRIESQIEHERSLGQNRNSGQGYLPQPGNEDRSLDHEFESRGMAAVNSDPSWQDDPLWQRLLPMAQDEYRAGFNTWLRTGRMPAEARALQVDLDTQGGYLTAPVQFVDRLLQSMDNQVFIRQWANVIAVPNADSLGLVSLDNDPADPTWTHELDIGTEDSNMSFGKRELQPHPLAKHIKVSRTLLRKAPSVEAVVEQRLGYKFSVAGENAYLNGTGAREPLGVFTASDLGISTSRDVSTGNDSDSPTFDGLIEAKYTLKTQYWARARWMFHRDGVKKIAKLKDGNGQYIWRESVRVGEPDRVLGFPTFMSEYAPNTFTANQYVGVLGDWSYYWIADSLMMDFQRLLELFVATNQVGIVGRLESDGMPVLEEAFVRVKLGS
jgi:HK97 family phage major capsid protein